jgi:hypothetical protein
LDQTTNKIRNHTYQYDEVVIGGTLKAALYAFVHNLPIVYNFERTPRFFEFLDPKIDLSALYVENVTTELKTKSGTKTIGMPKRDIWNRLLWSLSLSGKILFSDKASVIRIEEDNTVRVTTNNSRFAKIKYEKLTVFDPTLVQNIPNKILKKADDLYEVYDWMNITNGMNQEVDYFYLGDQFVNEVYLYPTDRVDGEQLSLKDILAISYLTSEQLQDFEYSDTYAKFKVLKLMKQNGIKGNMNGWRSKEKIKRCYYAFKVETAKREIVLLNKDIYEDSNNIKFMNLSIEDILQKYTENIDKDKYIYSLFSSLFSNEEN